jgi:GNAT superfamily N-acetyltransferase
LAQAREGARLTALVLRPRALDHPDAAALVGRLQAYYRVVYGGTDGTPIDAAEFAEPTGHFVVGYVDRVSVACGGWRARDGGDPALLPGDAEVKRMFVEPAQRGRGHGHAVLAHLEQTAAQAGRRRMVLETGLSQPAAIGLYLAAGYAPMAPFGTYRDEQGSRHYAKCLRSGTPQTSG